MKIVKKIALGLLLVLVLLQFWQPERPQLETIAENEIVFTSTEVAGIVQKACYDCHSNQTDYPFYAYVSPLNHWIQEHVEHGREELNFQEWNTFSDKRKAKKIHEIVEEVEEGKMPLESYSLVHSDAQLSDEERKMLLDYFKALE